MDATVVITTLPWRSTVIVPEGSRCTAAPGLEKRFRSPMRRPFDGFFPDAVPPALPMANRPRRISPRGATSPIGGQSRWQWRRSGDRLRDARQDVARFHWRDGPTLQSVRCLACPSLRRLCDSTRESTRQIPHPHGSTWTGARQSCGARHVRRSRHPGRPLHPWPAPFPAGEH